MQRAVLAPSGVQPTAMLATSANERTGPSTLGGWIAWLAPESASRYSVIFRTVNSDGELSPAWRIGPLRGRPFAIAIASRSTEALLSWSTFRGDTGGELYVQRVTNTGEKAGITTLLENGEYRERASDGGPGRTRFEHALSIHRASGERGYDLSLPALVGECYRPTTARAVPGECAPWRWLHWTRDDVFEPVAAVNALVDDGRPWLFAESTTGTLAAFVAHSSNYVSLMQSNAVLRRVALPEGVRVLSAWGIAAQWQAVLSQNIGAERRLTLWTSAATTAATEPLAGTFAPIQRLELRCRQGEAQVIIRARRAAEIVRSLKTAEGSTLGALALSTPATDPYEAGPPVGDGGAAFNPAVHTQWLGNILLIHYRDGSLATRRCVGDQLGPTTPLSVTTP